MSRVLIFHVCGHPYWHELPAMARAEKAAIEARLAELDCPRCWCGSDEAYAAAGWPAEPNGGRP